jgi:hypothetical protein
LVVDHLWNYCGDQTYSVLKEKHITRDQALAALAVACSTLTLNGKLMHESKEAQALIAAAAALGAFEHRPRVTASTPADAGAYSLDGLPNAPV